MAGPEAELVQVCKNGFKLHMTERKDLVYGLKKKKS